MSAYDKRSLILHALEFTIRAINKSDIQLLVTIDSKQILPESPVYSQLQTYPTLFSNSYINLPLFEFEITNDTSGIMRHYEKNTYVSDQYRLEHQRYYIGDETP